MTDAREGGVLVLDVTPLFPVEVEASTAFVLGRVRASTTPSLNFARPPPVDDRHLWRQMCLQALVPLKVGSEIGTITESIPRSAHR